MAQGDDERDPAAPGEPGRMRFQDGSTRPREPTLAERRAREQALRREAEERRRAEEEADGARRRRKRVLVGAGVSVGVVALIAVGYAAAQPAEPQTALCVDDRTNEVVDDSNCTTPATTANGGYYGGGFYPIFIGGGGRQYHYNYNGTGTIGQTVRGGTTAVPREGTRVLTPSGRDVSPRASSSGVSRGGLGVSGGGSSSGS